MKYRKKMPVYKNNPNDRVQQKGFQGGQTALKGHIYFVGINLNGLNSDLI